MGKTEFLEAVTKEGAAAAKDAAKLSDLAKAAGLGVKDMESALKELGVDAKVIEDAKVALDPALLKELEGLAKEAKVGGDVGAAGAKDAGIFSKLKESFGAAKNSPAAKQAAELASKAKDAAAKGLKNSAEAGAQMSKDVWASCKANKGICLASVLGTAAAIYAANEYFKAAKYVGQITSIEPGTDGGIFGVGGTPIAKVKYKEATSILQTDQLTFSGTDCSPSIDGATNVYKVAGPTEVWIAVASALESPGKTGTFKISTSSIDRLGNAVGKGAGAVGSAAGQAAGGAAGGAFQGLSGFFKGFAGGAGMYVVLCLCLLCFAGIIFKFIM